MLAMRYLSLFAAAWVPLVVAQSNTDVPPDPLSTTSTSTVLDTTTTSITSITATTATSTSTTASSSATPTGPPTTHTILVGANGQLVFQPPNITADIGDTVLFQFTAANHTVTQSSFAAPCEQLADTSSTTGFDSGFMPVSGTSNPTFQIVVNDTAPIWGYCRQVGHCGKGMVFAINADPNSANNFTAFQLLAEQINGTSTGTTTSSASSGTASSPATTSSSGKPYGNGALSLGCTPAMGFGLPVAFVVMFAWLL